MSTKENIILLFDQRKELTVKEITESTGASKQMVHLVMNALVKEKKVERLGRTPSTFYRMVTDGAAAETPRLQLSAADEDFLKKHFAQVTVGGHFSQGREALINWCVRRGTEPEKTLSEFKNTRSAYGQHFETSGIINGIDKLKNTKGYDKVHLDHLFYLDFYAIERFGKTRFGTLLHFAKQGQNKFLMKILMDEIRKPLLKFISEHQPDAIAYIPPSVPREIQFIRYLQNSLQLSLPELEIRKVPGLVPIPQRSLQLLEERIYNAEKTFAVTDKRTFRRVLLIDDEANSGATLNQIAGKIRDKGIADQVSAIAVVGQLKGFEALTEMKVVA